MPTKKAAAKKVAAKKATPAKKATAKKATPAKKAPVAKKPPAAKKATPAKKAASAKKPVKTTAPVTRTAKKAAPTKQPKPTKPAKQPPTKQAKPTVKQTTKQPVPPKRTKPVVLDKFLHEQVALLEQERDTYTEQAESLKAEADQLAQDMEPGDIQFDEESGEGATMNIDRERDLALSAQARAAVEEIEHALAKVYNGTYGACENCGQPIPRARLKALPYARLCVACKSGGLSRR